MENWVKFSELFRLKWGKMKVMEKLFEKSARCNFFFQIGFAGFKKYWFWMFSFRVRWWTLRDWGTVDRVHSHTWIWKFWVRSVGRQNQIEFPTRTFHTARAAGLKIYIIKFLKREYIIVSKNESHNFRALKIYNLMILILFNLIKAVLFFLFTKLGVAIESQK